MKVVDDFLYDDLYQDLVRDLNDLRYTHVDSYNGIEKSEALLDAETVGRIRSCYADKVADPVGVFEASITKCDPGYEYDLHADHPDKIVSTVLYLAPETGDGTLFLQKIEGTRLFFEEVVWLPNRLVTWKNAGQRHMYRNTKQEIRFTLNIYQKKHDVSFEVQNIYE